MWSARRPADAIGGDGSNLNGTAMAILRGVVIGSVLIGVWLLLRPTPLTARQTRQQLFAEIQPIALKNCTLQRFGNRNDGGYLMCGNLLGNVQSAYSYGIAGDDSWGCDISRLSGVTVHQYDCFDTTRPACPGGRPEFHAECVGGRTETIESRFYDSVTNQIEKNGDAGKTLVVEDGCRGLGAGFTADNIGRRTQHLRPARDGDPRRRSAVSRPRPETETHVPCGTPPLQQQSVHDAVEAVSLAGL